MVNLQTVVSARSDRQKGRSLPKLAIAVTLALAAAPFMAAQTPTLVSSAPANGALAVTSAADVVATFSKAMNPLSLSTSTFLLSRGSATVSGTVTYSGTSARFRPFASLAPNTQYIASLTRGATDVAGNALNSAYSWSFTTGAGGGQSAICLANFAVLAATTITNAGDMFVTGDVGISQPGAVLNFAPGVILGAVHLNDAAAAQGMSDITASYLGAVARTTGMVQISGDIGGQTLTQGLYQAASSLAVSSEDLTLDAKGDPGAVFIIQVGSTLTIGKGTRIVLAGGAAPSNIYWQVGDSAVLGQFSVFNGSILAQRSIALAAGVVVNGRLAALNGGVSMGDGAITSPLPSVYPGGVINAASGYASVAAGSIASVFGTNMGSGLTVSTGTFLAATLGGATYQVGGWNASLYMNSCGQVNLQIPWEVAAQTTPTMIRVTTGLQGSYQQAVNVVTYAPGIFALNQGGTGQGAVQIAPTAQLAALPPAGRAVTAGEYVSIFATGLGPVTNQPADGIPGASVVLSWTTTMPTVTIGNIPAQVTYSGLAPAFAGLYQINAIVPAGVTPGGSVPLLLTIGGVTSNTVTIAVQ